jgi:hypothetical protein
MKREDLKSLDIVTLRNGDRLINIENSLYDLSINNDNHLTNIDELTDDLKYYSVCGGASDFDVVKVERPTGYEEIFSRKEESKEMTLKEICDALGYEVKIKKD